MMAVFAAPLAAEKLDAWEAFIAQLKGPSSSEFEDLNSRHGLTGHQAYLQATPDGNYLVLVVNEGPGGDGFLPSVVASDHDFDRWFVATVADLHGIDTSGELPPPPVRKL